MADRLYHLLLQKDGTDDLYHYQIRARTTRIAVQRVSGYLTERSLEKSHGLFHIVCIIQDDMVSALGAEKLKTYRHYDDYFDEPPPAPIAGPESLGELLGAAIRNRGG